jgi:riboflavin synthase alpha subunit
MIWEYFLRPILGPFSGTVEGRIAIKKANQRFAHIDRFIAEVNESLSEYIPPGLISSAGVSLTAWSRQGDDIVSSLRLRSLRKHEMIIPLRITVGADQVAIGRFM